MASIDEYATPKTGRDMTQDEMREEPDNDVLHATGIWRLFPDDELPKRTLDSSVADLERVIEQAQAARAIYERRTERLHYVEDTIRRVLGNVATTGLHDGPTESTRIR